MFETIPTSPELPTEILDIIFGLIAASADPSASHHENKRSIQASLAASALVCRHWQFVAKRHLFKDLTCTLRVHVPDSNGDPLGNTKLDNLLGFLTASPSIPANVRKLELDMAITRASSPVVISYFTLHDPESCPVRLYKLLKLLPRVEAIRLSNICPFIPPSAMGERIVLPAVPKLDSLHIDYGRRADNAVALNKIAETLSYFGEIRHFELEDVEITDGDGLFSPVQNITLDGEVFNLRGRDELAGHCRFESIRFHKVRNASPLLEAFAQLPSIRSLRSLQLGCMFSGGCVGLTKFIRAVANNLEDLQFRAECTMNTLNLASLTALTSITIFLPIINETSGSSLLDATVPYSIPNALPRFLLSTPRSLRTVTIALRPTSGWDPKTLNDFGNSLLIVESALIQIADRQELESVIVRPEEESELTAADQDYLYLLLDKLRYRGLLRLI